MKKAFDKIKSYFLSIDPDYTVAVLCILAGLFVMYAFTGNWPTKDNPYNSFSLQAMSWLEGRLDLGMDYSYLELAIFDGKYFVSFPPFVSYVLLPFVMLNKGLPNTPDHFIAMAVFVIGAIYAVKLFKLMRKEEKGAIFFALFLFLASNTLFCGITGWVWFIAQNFAFTLTLMSVYYAQKGSIGLSLTFLACAVGCRPFQFIYLPILLIIYMNIWLSKHKENKSVMLFIKEHWYKCIVPLMLGLSYMGLNYARFKNPFEFGHNYLPEFTDAEHGQFSLHYVLNNLKSLIRLPSISEDKILTFPTFDGVNIFIVSPIFIAFIIFFIYAAVKRRTFNNKNKILIILLPCIFILHIFFIVCHRTMGGWHFGNRYTNDLLPFVYYAVLLFMPKNDTCKKITYPLFIFGLGINMLGTVIAMNYWN